MVEQPSGHPRLAAAADPEFGALMEAFPFKGTPREVLFSFWVPITLMALLAVFAPVPLWGRALFLLPVLAYVSFVALWSPRVSSWAKAKQALVYEHGLVVTSLRKSPKRFRYDEMRVLETIERRDWIVASQMVYLFAVSDGRGQKARLTKVYDRIDLLGKEIQARLTRAQLLRVLAEIDRGRTVEFGKLTQSLHGLHSRKHDIPWSEITDVYLASAIGQVNVTIRRITPQGTTDILLAAANKVPNVYLFQAAARQLAGGSGQPPP